MTSTSNATQPREYEPTRCHPRMRTSVAKHSLLAADTRGAGGSNELHEGERLGIARGPGARDNKEPEIG